jgi:hypothetical protein
VSGKVQQASHGYHRRLSGFESCGGKLFADIKGKCVQLFG